MPKKKIKGPLAADETAPDATPDVTPPTVENEQKSAIVGGIAISEEDAEVLRQPIDDRMAALLKDHQRMGARPK